MSPPCIIPLCPHTLVPSSNTARTSGARTTGGGTELTGAASAVLILLSPSFFSGRTITSIGTGFFSQK